MSIQVAASRKKKLIPDHDFKHFLPISALVVAGIFNRPTFVAFAAAPVFFWLQRGVATNPYFTPFQMFNFRVAALLPGFASGLPRRHRPAGVIVVTQVPGLPAGCPHIEHH